MMPIITRISNQEIDDPKKVFNINIGILGHVDAGKTALAKALSTVESTSAFDKPPQSKERGITIELGFSAFLIKIDEWLISVHPELKPFVNVQFSLVDCPGHASLIKTIIGGASIIDYMILVIDATKGIQTQTAECLLIGEILQRQLIVILNKVDSFEEETRSQKIIQVSENIKKVISATSFKNNFDVVPMISVAKDEKQLTLQKSYIDQLLYLILSKIKIPIRKIEGPFIFFIDHSFQIKGQGTVTTGTVLSGKANVGDVIEFPQLGDSKKIKSMQTFKKPVKFALQGDRVGICLPQFDISNFERGIACTPGSVLNFSIGIAKVKRVAYYKAQIQNKIKFHISIGHLTAIASCYFFDLDLHSEMTSIDLPSESNDKNDKSVKIEKIEKTEKTEKIEKKEFKEGKGKIRPELDNLNYHYVVLKFDQPIYAYRGSILIAAKLDADLSSKKCRIAFHGELISINPNHFLIKRTKVKKGVVEKVLSDTQFLVRDLFKKDSNIEKFLGKPVFVGPESKIGKIESTFGKIGKIKVNSIDWNCKDLIEGTEIRLEFEVDTFTKLLNPSTK